MRISKEYDTLKIAAESQEEADKLKALFNSTIGIERLVRLIMEE